MTKNILSMSMMGMLFLSAFTFTSCSQEENFDGVEDNGSEIVLNENVTKARTAIDALNEAINGIDGEQLAKAVKDIEEADDESFLIPSAKDKLISLLKNLPVFSAKVDSNEKSTAFSWENSAETFCIAGELSRAIINGYDEAGKYAGVTRERDYMVDFISKDGVHYNIHTEYYHQHYNDADSRDKMNLITLTIKKDDLDFLAISLGGDRDYIYDPVVDKKTFGSLIMNHTKDFSRNLVVKYDGMTVKAGLEGKAKREVNVKTQFYKDGELMADLNAKVNRSKISLFDHNLEAHVTLDVMDGMLTLDLSNLDLAKTAANTLNAHIIDQTRGQSLEKCTKLADELNEITKLNIQMGGEDFGKLTFGVRPCDCTCTNVDCKPELGTCTCGCGKYWQVVQLVEIPSMFNNPMTFAEVQQFLGIDIKELIQGIINGDNTGDDGEL